MKTRHWLAITAVQVGLSLGLLFRNSPSSGTAALALPVSVPNPSSQAHAIRPAGVPSDTTPRLSESAPVLSWSLLESDDYAAYAANLRTIGCPDQTVRDIITADVHALYASKRQKFLSTEPRKYWQAGYNDTASLPEIQRLEQEEESVLKLILKGLPASAPMDDEGMCLGTILGGRRNALNEWRTRYEQARSRVLDAAGERELTDEEIEQLEVLQRQQNEELATLLSPGELAEFELRNSPSADAIRGSLLGFEVTESEFRSLFNLRSAFDESEDAGVGPGSDWDRFQNSVREVLGEPRYALFARAQNPEFKDFFLEAQQQGLTMAEIDRDWSVRSRDDESSEKP